MTSQPFPGLRVAGAREGGRWGPTWATVVHPGEGGWESTQVESQVGTLSAVKGNLSRKAVRPRTDSL